MNNKNDMREINAEDFRTMHEMLSEIEIKTLGVDALKLMQFYRMIKDVIFEAWQDACNPNDSFLYK